MKTDVVKLMVRLPDEAKSFVEREARLNGSSQNSEIVRCIRERMDRLSLKITGAEKQETGT